MAKRNFKLDVSEGIATITFDWPEAVNAMGVDYSRDFLAMLDKVERDSEVRVLILTGSGKVFNGGGDLYEIMSPEPTDMEWELDLIRGYNKVAGRLFYFDIPVIAAVNGPAVGGGAGIALACDFAIAAEGARYDLFFHKLGLSVADVGVPWLLNRAIGPVLTNYYLLTAGTIDAANGHRLGLFVDVVPADQLMATARATATRIMETPERAVRISKLSLRHGVDMSFGANLEVEAYLQSHAFRTPGHKKRIGEYRQRLSRKKSGG
jgi:2-(1,2-epoxy-1,2-dihydrophenyl)acetyl-CoA isomerase